MNLDLFARAARGDHVAQGALVPQCLDAGQSGLLEPFQAVTLAEVYARMAAESGEAVDVRGLAGLLFIRGDLERGAGRADLADLYHAEGIQHLTRLADAGDEEAAVTLNMAGDVCSANALQIARGQPLIGLDLDAMEAKARECVERGDSAAKVALAGVMAKRAEAVLDTDRAAGAEFTGRMVRLLREAASEGDETACAVVDAMRRELSG